MSTVSDFVIDRLIEWDLHRFYGFPGDGIGAVAAELFAKARHGVQLTGLENFRVLRR